jgi:hypothetical protein
MKTIIEPGKHICLFCGKEKEKHFDDYTPYWECTCEDAKKTLEIERKIDILRSELPKERFKIVDAKVLVGL